MIGILERMARTQLVYVALLNEGVDCIRPVEAVAIRGDVYRLPEPRPNESDEPWSFPPGSYVRCVEETWEGKRVLVARERVINQSEPS